MEAKYKVGDKVYFIRSFTEIYWKYWRIKPPPKTYHPLERKIRDVVYTKNGVLYQVKDGHFHESWIGEVVFDTKEEAEKHMKGDKYEM